MQFPNAYKGVKKIWIAELLMLFVVVATVALVVVMITGGYDPSLGTGLDNISGTRAGVIGGLAIVISVLIIVAFILKLVGVINAKKDEGSFGVALYAILLGIAITAVNTFIGKQYPASERWLTLGTSVCSLFSTYFILGGIGNLAERMGDKKVKVLADKARNVLCITFAASYLLKLIPGFISDPNVSSVVNSLGLVLEIVSYGFLLVVLSRGKKMLAA